MIITFALFTSIAAFIFSWFLTGLVLRIATRFSILDHPNLRSSHTDPTARGGGFSIVVVVLGAIVGLYFSDQMPFVAFMSLAIGGMLVAGIGIIDDYQHVPALGRLLIQILAASFAVGMSGGLPFVQIGGCVVDLGLAGDLVAIIFTVWFINLYNFMDGIDGIAAVEAICISVGALVILLVGGNSGYFVILLTVFAAAVFGFLIWNWPPAKIFMGDVGSGFIGFVLATLAIIISNQDDFPIWSWLILAGVFVVDSTITLITRVINGEQWYSAHNDHAYQKASRRLMGHRPVTLAVLAINVLWLLPIAWFTSTRPEFGWALTVVAWIPLIAISLFFRAGRPDRSD